MYFFQPRVVLQLVRRAGEGDAAVAGTPGQIPCACATTCPEASLTILNPPSAIFVGCGKAQYHSARKAQGRNPSTLRSSATEDGESERGPSTRLPGLRSVTALQTSGSNGSYTTPRQTPASLDYLRRHAGSGRDSNPARPCRIQLHAAADAGRAGLRQVEPLEDGGQRIDQDQVWPSGSRNRL